MIYCRFPTDSNKITQSGISICIAFIGMGRRSFQTLNKNLSPTRAGQMVICLLAVIAQIAFLSVARADTATTIGFVDIPFIINNAPQALEAEQRLAVEFAPREEELKAQRANLAELNDRLKAEALELSDIELAQLDREVRNLERRIKRDEQDFREELNIQKNNEFKKVRILVLEAIAKFGKANDYDLIISDGVLYANKRIDVTGDILDRLRLASQNLQSSN